MTNKVKIVMDHHGLGTVWLNGAELEGVRKILFHAEVDRTNRVRIELICDEVEITADEVEPVIVDVTQIADTTRRYARAKRVASGHD